MEFGVAFPSRVGDSALVKLAEDLGYDQAWFYDSQMLCSDCFATMALAADRTSRIRLGTGVAVPTMRVAAVIAQSIATINQIAPGRVELGLGAGNSACLTMGMKAIPVATIKREIRIIRALLRGDTAMLHEDGVEHPIRFLHPNHDFINLRDPIPVTVSALAPKMLAFTGAEMDAHMTFGSSVDDMHIIRQVLADVAERNNRTTVPTKGLYPTAVLAPGETAASPRIMKSMAPFAANYLHVQMEFGSMVLPVLPKVAEVIERYRAYWATLPKYDYYLKVYEGHMLFGRPEEREFLVPELINEAGLVGEPDDLIARIHALEDAGLSHFAFQVTDDPERQLRDFAELVMRRY